MMNYRCVEISRDKWMAVARDCPYATYFHTPYWYDIITSDRHHIALEITFDDGVSALIPIAKIKRMGGLFTDHFSSPGGTYGGWISTSSLNNHHVKPLVGILTSKKNLTFRINPFCPLSISSIPSIQDTVNANNLTDDFTHILDLTKGADELYRGFSRGHKSAINGAVHGGVVIKAAEALEEWDQYYNLYTASIERWRMGGAKSTPKTVYPQALFRRIYENRTGNETLWLAFKDGEPISGALIFYWNRHAVYWHGAASDKHFHLKPNNLLHWEIIKNAANRGCEIYDFNPSGGYGGVESFKERFGAVQTSSPIITTRTPLRSLITRIRRKK